MTVTADRRKSGMGKKSVRTALFLLPAAFCLLILLFRPHSLNQVRPVTGGDKADGVFCALETAKSPFLLLKILISPGFWYYIPFYWLKINVLKSETKKSVSLSQIEARPALYVVCDCKRPKR